MLALLALPHEKQKGSMLDVCMGSQSCFSTFWRSNTWTSLQRDFTFGKISSTISVWPCKYSSYLGCLIPSQLFSPPVIHPDRPAGYNQRMRLTEEVLISVDDMCESSISFCYYSPRLSSSVRVSRAVCLTRALVCGNLAGPVGRGTR